MDAERWGRVRALFDDVVELPDAERAARLDAACAGDAALRADVESLLRADAAAGGTGSVRDAAPNLLDDFAARARADADDRLVGLRLGPWEVVRRIGVGGMGSVYLGARHDGEFEQQVAIKVLTAAGGGDPELPARFRAERRILAQLEHPNVARLLDGGALPDGTPYLVMEYVEGERIDDHCASRRLPLAARLDLVVKVCRAVQAAHRALVVHRDLKPANVLVGADGEPKLLDFGIAKVIVESGGDAPATADGDRLLTPRYAAPEQVRGGRITTATDVYALGVILYELLTGVSPYASPTLDTLRLIREVVDLDPPPPSRAPQPASGAPPVERRALRGDLDAIVAKALRKEPERRYATVDALAEDLRRHLRGEAVEARHGDRAYRALRLVRRHRLAFAVLAAVLLGLAATALTWRAQRDAIARERDRAEQATGFLLDVFDQADPFVHRGNPPPLTDLVRRGAERLGAAADADPALRAELLSTLARVQLRLGAFPDALKSARTAQELLAKAPDGSAGLRTTVALQAADALRETNAADDARGAYERVLAGTPAPGVRALALRGLGRMASDDAKADEAKRLLDASVAAHLEALGAADVDAALRDARPDAAHEALADTLQVACRVGVDGGRDDALAWCRRSLALRERLHPADHPSLAAPTSALARLHAARREFAAAVDADERALAILVKALGPDHATVGAQQLNTGLDLVAWGRYADALGHYEDALRIMSTARGPDHPFTLLARNNLANLKYLLGDYRASLALHQDVAARRGAALPAGHPDLAQSYNNIARAHWRLGEVDAADARWNDALAVYAAGGAGPPDSRSVRIGLAWLALARGATAAALAAARALVAEIEAEAPDLDGLGSALFLEARALHATDPAAARERAERARRVLDADDRTRYLANPAEIDAWLAAPR